ncbi:hypothetical protein [Rhodovulum euryhalinum]|uniref:Uncharacterized protein n=1 Tax=Rhodovulum euryhalinum TaxID=35805 RepID=A0A4R2KEZ2_9RHOB|nr:hypothetical protein [Rhodovulum euryhalinum]TCO68906.1 hypothetical protein EV655_12123 [Rhodovulum euryhalinum]
MAVACVRNTQLEALHAGRTPISRTGDGSDVIVQDAEGNRIPWSEVSRIDDDEMRAVMREIVDRLYTFHLRIDDPAFRAEIDRWAAMTAKWDAAKPDPVLSAIPGKTPEHG